MTLRIVLATSALLCLAACGMTDMPNKMDDMNDKMNTTNSAIHKQTLMVALDHLFSKENTQYLTPVPTGMMPWGQAFANEMHEDEFVNLVDLYLKDINDVVPDDSLKDAKTGKWPADLAASVDRDKTIKFYAIMIIAGFASQSMIDQVVATEMTNGGQFTTAATAILEARSLFIHDVLLEETLLSEPLDTPGKISVAMERARYLDDIAALPFATSIEFKTTGMLLAEDNVDDVLDPASSVPIWAQIDQAFDSDLQKKFKTPATMAMRNQVQEICRAHGNWDKKSAHCSPTLTHQ